MATPDVMTKVDNIVAYLPKKQPNQVDWTKLLRPVGPQAQEGHDNTELDEVQSTLGSIKMSKRPFVIDDEKMKDVLFLCILTHECRGSHGDENLLPVARINDGKMFLCGFPKASTMETYTLVSGVGNKGAHINMEKFFYHEVDQLKFEPCKLIVP